MYYVDQLPAEIAKKYLDWHAESLNGAEHLHVEARRLDSEGSPPEKCPCLHLFVTVEYGHDCFLIRRVSSPMHREFR